MSAPTVSSKPYVRWSYLLVAYSCVGLAAVGVVLPGLPTTPFLLVAAWAAGRGSQRLYRWLYTHRHFGPPLRHWQEQRAVSTRAKFTALALLVLSWLLLTVRSETLLIPVISGLFFAAVAGFLMSRPQPRASEDDDNV